MATSNKSASASKSAAASKGKAFNVRPLVAACNTAEKALVRADQARNKTFDKLADSFRAAGVTVEMLKGNSKTSAPRKVIKEFADRLVEKGLLSKATAATYQSCFWIAFEKAVPFSPSLANAKSKEKAAASANVGKGNAKERAEKTKGSIVVTASRENLQSLLMQAIKMARDLALGDFALELVESGRCIDLLPKSFK